MVAIVGSGGFGFDEATASAIYGIFAGSLYLAAVPGGWLADNWLGQERALLAALIVGVSKEKGMWHVGFGVGGLGMLASLLIYRLSAKKTLNRYASAKNITPEWEQTTGLFKNVGR